MDTYSASSAVNGDKDVVKLLVSGSADPNKSDIYGKAPLISNIPVRTGYVSSILELS